MFGMRTPSPAPRNLTIMVVEHPTLGEDELEARRSTGSGITRGLESDAAMASRKGPQPLRLSPVSGGAEHDGRSPRDTSATRDRPYGVSPPWQRTRFLGIHPVAPRVLALAIVWGRVTARQWEPRGLLHVGIGNPARGLCGGMAFVAMDRFERGADAPPDGALRRAASSSSG